MILTFHQFIWKNLPAGARLLCPIKLAMVALLPTAARQASKAKYLEPLGDQGHQRCARQVPCVRGAEAAIPPLLLGMCRFGFQLHCVFQAQFLFFLSLVRGRWGKGNIYEYSSVFAILFVSLLLFSLFSVCLVLVFTCSIPNEGASCGPSAFECKEWRKDGLQPDKETIQNSGIYLNALQNTLAFLLEACKDKVPIQKDF